MAIVGVTNAVNLIDGIDGLAASIGIIGCAIFGSLFFFNDQLNYAILCAATVGSLSSFFAYNVFGKANKIFMGDTGSLILGLILSICAIKYNESTIGGNQVVFRHSPVFSLAILAIPIFDMVRIFSRRILDGKSPFSPDMNHIHHKFLRLGLSHRKCTFVIVLINIVIIGAIGGLKAEDNHELLFILLMLVSATMILPEAIYRYNLSKNNRKNKKQIQSYFIPYKTDSGHRLKANSNSIVYMGDQIKEEEKKKKNSGKITSDNPTHYILN